MFQVYNFLIYCFVNAYTPGANNLLSMSYAAQLGFRRSVRFNFGILTGFAVVMTMCTVFTSTLYSYLPRVKIVMQVFGSAFCKFLSKHTKVVNTVMALLLVYCAVSLFL